MKKIYAILLVLFPLIIKAQTITQADLPTVNTAFSMGSDSTFSGAIPPQGQNQNWDLSTLLNLSTDTSVFIDAAGTPYAATFSTANVAAINLRDNSFGYFTNDATGFYFNGVGTPDLTLKYDPSQLFVPVPFSYSNTSTNSARLQIDTNVSGFDTRVVNVIESIYKADGTGTLIIPSGTYQNVLRVKITETEYDSIYVALVPGTYTLQSSSSTLTYHYRWFTTGSDANYLLGIDANDLGVATSSEYLVASGLSVPKLSFNKEMLAYPNPATDYINFKNLNSNSRIKIYDADGKLVVNNNQSDGKVNVETLKNGVYHYEIILNDKTQKGSFVVQH